MNIEDIPTKIVKSGFDDRPCEQEWTSEPFKVIDLKIRPLWNRILRWPLQVWTYYHICRRLHGKFRSLKIGMVLANMTIGIMPKKEANQKKSD